MEKTRRFKTPDLEEAHFKIGAGVAIDEWPGLRKDKPLSWEDIYDEYAGSFLTADDVSGKSERQRQRDMRERLRVKSLNAVLLTALGKSLHAARGVRNFEFTPFDVDMGSLQFRTRSSNIETLAQVLIELEMVKDDSTQIRYMKAVERAEKWSDTDHKELLARVGSTPVMDKVEAAAPIDDGIDLDEAVDGLLDTNPLAGSW